MEVLKSVPDRVVVLEDDGSVVRKTFVGDDPTQLAALAAREFERMAAFHDALAGCPAATCPRPLEIVYGRQPYIRMTRAAGLDLPRQLDDERWPADRFRRVGATIHDALVTYVRAFDEPYWDCILRNVFYEPAAELVTFLDFEIPPALRPHLAELGRYAPLEVSLGVLVASPVFDARRPRWMGRRLGHRQGGTLVAAVLRCLPDGAVDLERVREIAGIAYRLAAEQGGRLRRGWYRRSELLASSTAAIDRILDR